MINYQFHIVFVAIGPIKLNTGTAVDLGAFMQSRSMHYDTMTLCHSTMSLDYDIGTFISNVAEGGIVVWQKVTMTLSLLGG